MAKPTIADIAQAAGVSAATVSYVLSGSSTKRFSPETREAVRAAAQRLGYFAARSRQNEQRSIALILPSVFDPAIPPMIKGVQSAANMYGYSVFTFDYRQNPPHILGSIEYFCKNGIDGMVFAYPEPMENIDRVLLMLKSYQQPAVMIGLQSPGFDAVMCNYRAAGELLARTVLDKGHREIALLMTGKESNSRREKLLGMDAALSKAGGSLTTISIPRYQDVNSFSFDVSEYRCGLSEMQRQLLSGFDKTVVIGCNALVTLGIVKAIHQAGLRIPEDISVASFGGNLALEASEPIITYVDQLYLGLGRASFDLLRQKMRQPQKEDVTSPEQTIVFQPTLFAGRSIGKPKSK